MVHEWQDDLVKLPQNLPIHSFKRWKVVAFRTNCSLRPWFELLLNLLYFKSTYLEFAARVVVFQRNQDKIMFFYFVDYLSAKEAHWILSNQFQLFNYCWYYITEHNTNQMWSFYIYSFFYIRALLQWAHTNIKEICVCEYKLWIRIFKRFAIFILNCYSFADYFCAFFWEKNK